MTLREQDGGVRVAIQHIDRGLRGAVGKQLHRAYFQFGSLIAAAGF
jgi:hypothetical protein